MNVVAGLTVIWFVWVVVCWAQWMRDRVAGMMNAHKLGRTMQDAISLM